MLRLEEKRIDPDVEWFQRFVANRHSLPHRGENGAATAIWRLQVPDRDLHASEAVQRNAAAA